MSKSKPQPFLARSKSESLLARGKSEPLFVRPAQTGGVYDVILYFVIIDILQDYDINKKLEHAYKSLQVDPSFILAVDPKLYSRSIRDFVHRIFSKDK